MSVFCDTSGFFALIHRGDRNHSAASDTWAALLERGDRLVTSNYILVEMIALVQSRVGLRGVRAFLDATDAVVATLWVDETLHAAALESALAEPSRNVSFVDRTSFALMRRNRIERAFAFDADFTRLGFAFPA